MEVTCNVTWCHLNFKNECTKLGGINIIDDRILGWPICDDYIGRMVNLKKDVDLADGGIDD